MNSSWQAGKHQGVRIDRSELRGDYAAKKRPSILLYSAAANVLSTRVQITTCYFPFSINPYMIVAYVLLRQENAV